MSRDKARGIGTDGSGQLGVFPRRLLELRVNGGIVWLLPQIIPARHAGQLAGGSNNRLVARQPGIASGAAPCLGIMCIAIMTLERIADLQMQLVKALRRPGDRGSEFVAFMVACGTKPASTSARLSIFGLG